MNSNVIKEESSRMFDKSNVWQALSEKNAIVQTSETGAPLPAKVGRTYFNFTKTFDERASNKEIYDGVCQSTIKSFVSGVDGIVIAHGQTGSGKTFTMQGTGSTINSKIHGGMIQMSAFDIFTHISSCPQCVFTVRVSIFELYKQEICDLLSNQVISSRLDPKTKCLVDATERVVTDYKDFIDLLSLTNERRQVRRTEMNENSSRSHVLYRISLERKNDIAASSEERKQFKPFISTLYLVDLAGTDSSMRFASKVKGDQQKEANSINKR